MKKQIRITSFMLAICLLLSGTALASTLGDELHTTGTPIADGTQLASGVFWSSSYSDKLAENYVEYTPSSAVRPIVSYGSKVTSYGSFKTMADQVEASGYHVIGGINGDYFDPNYQPCGILISDGVLRSSDGGLHGVGFKADGTAVVEAPYMGMSVTIGGEVFPLVTYNKKRSGGGFALFSDDFAVTTQTSGSGWDVILTGTDKNSIKLNTVNTFTVESVQKNSSAQNIPEGKLVLSLSESADEWRRGAMENLAAGAEVTVTISGSHSWSDVQYGVGSMNLLVKDGQPSGTYSDGGVHPRTAVGVKADGSVILYTIDGRQSGHSVGASQKQIAERLIELGCVNAGLMDGGGSTSLNALYIGDESLSQINSPSDGSARSVSNYIMLVTTAPASGVAERIGVYPFDLMILSGAKKQFSSKGADAAGYPAALGQVEYSVDPSLGEVGADGTFTAGANGGTGNLNAKSGQAEGYATITVVDSPHSIQLWNEANWKPISSLNMQAGASINLAATGTYNRYTLVSSDNCFTWEAAGDIGTIDEAGNFTAGKNSAKGSIVVSCGGVSATIPVSIGWANPFVDVKAGDWFHDSVEYVVTENLFQGVSGNEFAPNTTMTRGMFVTVLGRMDNVQKDRYTSTNFGDVNMNDYYGPYVAWAAENGIVEGADANTFLPNASITREQMCVIIERYVKYLGRSLPNNTEGKSFADAGSISSYATAAVSSCQQAGLVTGKENNMFAPQGTASRAEVATIITRLSRLL